MLFLCEWNTYVAVINKDLPKNLKVKYLLILNDMGALVMGAPEKYDATYYGDDFAVSIDLGMDELLRLALSRGIRHDLHDNEIS
jgi:hypothetical protein